MFFRFVLHLLSISAFCTFSQITLSICNIVNITTLTCMQISEIKYILQLVLYCAYRRIFNSPIVCLPVVLGYHLPINRIIRKNYSQATTKKRYQVVYKSQRDFSCVSSSSVGKAITIWSRNGTLNTLKSRGS